MRLYKTQDELYSYCVRLRDARKLEDAILPTEVEQYLGLAVSDINRSLVLKRPKTGRKSSGSEHKIKPIRRNSSFNS